MNDLHGALVLLADRGTPTGSQLLRERVAIDLASDRGRQWAAPPPRGLRIAVAAAIAVIVILGGTLLVSRLTSESTTVVTEPPVVTTVPPPEITLPPPDAGPIPGFTPGAWGRVGADTMQPVVGLFDMTVVGSRMVAVGFDPGENFRQDGVIFASDDGETWIRLAKDDPALTLGAVLMYGVTEGGPGIVAVGMGCEDEEEGCGPYTTIWTSVDGTSWTRTPTDPEVFGDPATQSSAAFAATTTTDGLIVAVGSMEDWVLTDEGEVESITGRPVVWTSADGLAWDRSWQGNGVTMTMDQFLEASPVMQAVARGPDGLLVGVGSAVDDGVSVAAVWTSSDGSTWQRVPHDPATFAGADGEGAQMLDVTAGDSGLVAVGSAAGTPAVWTSPDGLSWARVAPVDDEFDGSFSSVAALGTGFVAAGPHGFADMGEAPLTLWTSPDGLGWDRVLVLGQGYAQAIVATETGIAVGGGLFEGDDFHAGVWTGLAFDPLAPPPAPELPEAPPAEEASGVADLEAGLGCDDLSALGYSFAEAASYWEWEGRPAAMDEDGDGIPCQSAYVAGEVEIVFGSSDALDVVLISDLAVNRFEATGPAVDAGLLCEAGTQEYSGDAAPLTAGALFRWEDLYTCDDGSGSFVVGADVFIGDGNHEYGVWDLGSGTGAYELLGGGGSVDTLFDESDVLSGRAEPVADDLAGLRDLDGLEAGLTCDDLSALGYSYAQAASYWERDDRPAAMDDDGNGVPCEAVYDPAVVATVFGSAEALDVVLTSDLSVNRFEATGPAVDAGLVCAAGTQAFLTDVQPRTTGALFRWENRYTCDDGSGSFVVGADVFIGGSTHEYGVWDLVSGTGAYELLGGGGSVHSVFDESDVLTGRAELVIVEP